MQNRLLLKIHSPPEDVHTDYAESQILPWDNDQTAVSWPSELDGSKIEEIGQLVSKNDSGS